MASLAHARPVALILSQDRGAAEAFYADVLGLGPAYDDGFAAVYEMGGATLRITHAPDFRAGPHPVLGWQVDDIEAQVDALVAAGAEMTIYPGMGQDARGIWTSPDGSARVAFFADPDGNVLSLTQAG